MRYLASLMALVIWVQTASADTAATAVERLDALHRPVTRALARQVLDEMSAAVEVETD